MNHKSGWKVKWLKNCEVNVNCFVSVNCEVVKHMIWIVNAYENVKVWIMIQTKFTTHEGANNAAMIQKWNESKSKSLKVFSLSLKVPKTVETSKCSLSLKVPKTVETSKCSLSLKVQKSGNLKVIFLFQSAKVWTEMLSSWTNQENIFWK